jgi:hypothetical protein
MAATCDAGQNGYQTLDLDEAEACGLEKWILKGYVATADRCSVQVFQPSGLLMNATVATKLSNVRNVTQFWMRL